MYAVFPKAKVNRQYLKIYLQNSIRLNSQGDGHFLNVYSKILLPFKSSPIVTTRTLHEEGPVRLRTP